MHICNSGKTALCPPSVRISLKKKKRLGKTSIKTPRQVISLKLLLKS